MINIKSLTKLTEADDQVGVRHKTDIAKAEAEYDKVGGSRTFGFKRGYDWGFTPGRNRELGAAKYDLQSKLDAADARHKAGHKGLVTQQDHDEVKFEASKAKGALAAKTAAKAKEVATDPDKHEGITGAIGAHPWLAAAGVAGIAGLAAMQKRKSRLPEPGSYNN